MTEGGKPANDLAPRPITVTEQVFENFYKRLEATQGLAAIGKRFRENEKRNRENLEKILFGDGDL